MDLSYVAADVLGMTLHETVDGTLEGNEGHMVMMGPWHAPLPLHAVSDIRTDTEVGLWVTLATTVRLYVVVREHSCWLLVLDAGLLARHRADFTATTVIQRVKELKAVMKGVFYWRGGEWDQVKYDEQKLTTGG